MIIQKGNLLKYSLHLADNSLILGHRLSEWAGHGPILEQDIAMSNIGLDLIGQARNFYQYCSLIDDKNQSEDYYAYLRQENQYSNLLLLEHPNLDFGYTVARRFLYSNFAFLYFAELKKSTDLQLSAIAEKSLKEIAYHVRWANEWIIRLGDGTEESHNRIQQSINDLWKFTGEFFTPTEFEIFASESNFGVDVLKLKHRWKSSIENVFNEATLTTPNDEWMLIGGKNGVHTESMGYLLSELQYLQRLLPNSNW